VPTLAADPLAFFGALSAEAQAKFLAQYAFELTIASRDTYEVGTDALTDPRRLRKFNELQHRILGHLRDLLRGDSDRRPDSSMVNCMICADDIDIGPAAGRAFERTALKFGPHS
jgi:hypothetical protein